MPKGEGQSNKRRGPYAPRGDKPAIVADGCVEPKKGQHVVVPFGRDLSVECDLPAHWSPGDVQHFVDRVANSTEAKPKNREHAAMVATMLYRQMQELDSRPRTVDESKVLYHTANKYKDYVFAVLGKPVEHEGEDEEL